MFVFVCFYLDFHLGIYITYYSVSRRLKLRTPGSLNSDPYDHNWWARAELADNSAVPHQKNSVTGKPIEVSVTSSLETT